MSKPKLMIGYRNIHRANVSEEGAFETPVRVENGRKTSNKLNYESSQAWGDDKIIMDSALYAGGEGTTTFLGLTMDEYTLLFDHLRVKGGMAITDEDSPKTGAWLWERQKKGTKHKRLYCLYACTCKPVGFDAESIIDGKGDPEEVEVEYSIGSYTHTDGKTYIAYVVDTDDPTVDQETISKWYTAVQFPKENTPPVEQSGQSEEIEEKASKKPTTKKVAVNK